MTRQQPRAPRVGIRDVADRAGVGLATASRVLAGQQTVGESLRRRVLAAATELGYEPNVLAQGLRRGVSRTVGFIADDLSNHLIADIATGAERALRANGYFLLVMNSEMDPELDSANIRVLRARQTDGLMMAPVIEDDPQVVGLLASLDIPFVDVEGDLPTNVPASYVHSDHRAGVVAALRDLIARGHERISVVVGSAAFRSARERMLGVRDVQAACAPHIRIDAVETVLDPAGGRAAVSRAMRAEPPPSALIVGGWQLLTGVLHGLREHSLRLGVDIALVASDPPRLASVFEPPIASITRDTAGLGIHAAHLLLARIAKPDMAAERVVLPTVYVPAASADLVDVRRQAGTRGVPRRRRRAKAPSGSSPSH